MRIGIGLGCGEHGRAIKIGLAVAPDMPRIAENGLTLEIPAAADLAPRRLRYAAKGRRLFNRDDEATARTLLDIHGLVSQNRDAYESGVRGERERISRDVHDNIGAQLLSALHTPDGTRKDDLLRDTLGDLRGIINAGFHAQFDLTEIVADLHTELADRLELHNLVLDWPQNDASLDGVVLDFRQANSLRAILREAASNTIKHAQATRMEVALICTADRLQLVVRDDGCGFAAGSTDGGNGLANIVERAHLLNGVAHIREQGQGGGTEVAMTLPLTHAQQVATA